MRGNTLVAGDSTVMDTHVGIIVSTYSGSRQAIFGGRLAGRLGPSSVLECGLSLRLLRSTRYHIHSLQSNTSD